MSVLVQFGIVLLI